MAIPSLCYRYSYELTVGLSENVGQSFLGGCRSDQPLHVSHVTVAIVLIPRNGTRAKRRGNPICPDRTGTTSGLQWAVGIESGAVVGVNPHKQAVVYFAE